MVVLVEVELSWLRNYFIWLDLVTWGRVDIKVDFINDGVRDYILLLLVFFLYFNLISW